MGFGASSAAASSDAVRGFPGQHGAGGAFLWSAVFALVLETNVKLLTNPLFFRAALVLIGSAAAFVMAVIGMRILRREIVEENVDGGNSEADQTLPLQAYAVIQQLKQQKFELQNEQQVQRRRAKTSEHIMAAMIANLPCGTLFVAPNGILRQANGAARNILGFASPMGMSFNELFRETAAVDASGEHLKLTDALDAVLNRKSQDGTFEANYITPAGGERALRLNLVPAFEPGGKLLGVACVISDRTEFFEARQDAIMRREEAAEMALELRTSLSTIREWAEQIGAADEAKLAQSFAVDIFAETERLEKSVGGFLAGKNGAKAAHA